MARPLPFWLPKDARDFFAEVETITDPPRPVGWVKVKCRQCGQINYMAYYDAHLPKQSNIGNSHGAFNGYSPERAKKLSPCEICGSYYGDVVGRVD